MRTADVTINGKTHLLCYNLRLIRSAAARYGSVEGMYEALSNADEVKAMDEAVWVLAQMMAAGSRYAAEMGIETAPPLSEAQLLDLCDLTDFFAMKSAIIRTVTAGKTRHVETSPVNDNEGEEKNGETTRES